MKITILTLFDNICLEFINSSIIKKAIENQKIEIEVINFRNYSKAKNKQVDDYQYGGGPGMVLQLEPIVAAINDVKTSNTKTILTSPSGIKFDQAKAIEWANKKNDLILIAGHYEGFDARIKNFIDEEVSIGDYVLTGGELPVLVILDAIVRLLPGVINEESLTSESFNDYLLDYPVYTKPVDFNGYKVPEVLLSGNHQKISEYRLEQRISLTKINRPDLYQKFLEKGKANENK